MDRPDLVKALDNYMLSQIKTWIAKSNRASQIGDPCIRKLVYFRLYPELQEMTSVDLQYIFNEGGIQERALLQDLAKAGYHIQETQRDFYDQRYQLSGHIDGTLTENGSRWPIEIKSMSPHIWDSINVIEDLQKYSWTAKYPAQLQSYMLLMNLEPAIILFKNKSTGKIKQFWIDLDYEYAESLLQKCETINSFVAKNELPIHTLSEDCQSCPFHTSCCPESIAQTPLEFINQSKLEADILQWELLKDYALEYNRLDKSIKERLRGIEKAAVGNYLIQGKQLKSGWRVNISSLETVK